MTIRKFSSIATLTSLLVILTACHSIKQGSIFASGIKTVRSGNNSSNKVIQKQHVVTENTENEVEAVQVTHFATQEVLIETIPQQVEEINHDTQTNTYTLPTRIANPEDSLSKEEAELIAREALETEDLAKKARKTGILGLVFSFLPFLGFVGLILSIIALSRSIKALRAQYITEKGLEMARTGLILSIISLGLRVLALILLIVIILVFI
jgi:hypothetical protein